MFENLAVLFHLRGATTKNGVVEKMLTPPPPVNTTSATANNC